MTQHMEKTELPVMEERAVRLEKLQKTKAAGIDPFPSTIERDHTVAEVLGRFDDLSLSGKVVTVVGRVKAVRGHGGACFADIEDGTEKIQLHLKSDVLGASSFELFAAVVDRGDFVQVSGVPFVTKRGEKSIEAKEWRPIAKALGPQPDKWDGLADVETRYRHRELDLVSNPEVRGIFKKRSAIVRALRDFLHERDFMEVETPIFQPIAGGATARPFVTHHNALDADLFLRIAPELYLKRLIVGGFERVFEIGRNFRNEGIDHSHNPEFTAIEFYQAYADYRDLMTMTEKMLVRVAEAATGKTSVEFDGHTIEFAGEYPRLTFKEAIKHYAHLDIDEYPDRASLAKVAEERGVKVESSADRGAILDDLYKKTVRPHIIQPTFLIDHPVEILPLAKRVPNDPKHVESFQLVLGGGVELVKAFSELNDPIDQRSRFEEQEKLREGGDTEAQQMDEAFIAALETGMPPTAGFGMGIDRLVAVLTDSHSLKEVILFPTLRPVAKE